MTSGPPSRPVSRKHSAARPLPARGPPALEPLGAVGPAFLVQNRGPGRTQGGLDPRIRRAPDTGPVPKQEITAQHRSLPAPPGGSFLNPPPGPHVSGRLDRGKREGCSGGTTHTHTYAHRKPSKPGRASPPSPRGGFGPLAMGPERPTDPDANRKSSDPSPQRVRGGR